MVIRSVSRFIVWWCFWHPLTPPPAEPLPPLRLVETQRIHLGIRPALANDGVGITVQLSWQ